MSSLGFSSLTFFQSFIYSCGYSYTHFVFNSYIFKVTFRIFVFVVTTFFHTQYFYLFMLISSEGLSARFYNDSDFPSRFVVIFLFLFLISFLIQSWKKLRISLHFFINTGLNSFVINLQSNLFDSLWKPPTMSSGVFWFKWYLLSAVSLYLPVYWQVSLTLHWFMSLLSPNSSWIIYSFFLLIYNLHLSRPLFSFFLY